jgi:hypothetical protein
MTEIAVRPDAPMELATAADDPVARLASWAEVASAAHQIAVSLCKTSFVPAHYRDKPHEGAAAIVAGAELGIPGPLAALRAFHPINGTPTLSALAMRAITQSHGHEVVIKHSDATRAEVAVRRKGSDEWQTAVWTIERAEIAGLVGGRNANWKTNPTAMLIARATSEGCRWVASDALMGMPYSAEELQDQPELVGGSTPAPRPTARRLLAADLDEPAPPAIEPDGPITAEQRTDMAKLWDLLGYTGDENREVRLQVTARILGLGNELESSDELTRVEADQVIDSLRYRLRQAGGPNA